MTNARWVCCHLGAREHYAVPRALHRHQRLHLLITDAWVRPGSVWSGLPGELPRRLSERFHSELASARVRSFTPSLVVREALWRSQHTRGWEQLMARNDWFGRRAAAALRRIREPKGLDTVVFAHSYSAREVFTYAKSRGWATVLGQIDPGPEHFRMVQQLSKEHAEYGSAPPAPPPAYFEAWRDECRLADWIVVNSEWSREALSRAGIPPEKLRVVVLPFEPDTGAPPPTRAYPSSFTRERPLRALFVGHAAVAKGVPALLEGVAQLTDVPVELRLVGDASMTVPERFSTIRPFTGWVRSTRLDVMRHYYESDVLVFPSLSDGFGMAQIEAQGCGLPIIASLACGRVVENRVNGLLLQEVSPEAIAGAIREVAADPLLLSKFASNSRSNHQSGVAGLGAALLQLEP